MKNKENVCPKCGHKLSIFYLKQNCPNCGVDLLYYKLDERLLADAQQAQRQTEKVNKLISTIKSSLIASPILLIRFILFFTPLASMCLPMYGEISLVKLIIGIMGNQIAIGDVIMPVASVLLVVLLSIAVIISSLFSSAKSGLKRNLIFSALNTTVFVTLGLFIGDFGIGWYITLAIYIVEILMHFICNSVIENKRIREGDDTL